MTTIDLACHTIFAANRAIRFAASAAGNDRLPSIEPPEVVLRSLVGRPEELPVLWRRVSRLVSTRQQIANRCS